MHAVRLRRRWHNSRAGVPGRCQRRGTTLVPDCRGNRRLVGTTVVPDCRGSRRPVGTTVVPRVRGRERLITRHSAPPHAARRSWIWGLGLGPDRVRHKSCAWSRSRASSSRAPWKNRVAPRPDERPIVRRVCAAAPSSTRRSRHVPAAVRRVVWSRDQGRCAFVGERGRCTETGRLEFHHLVPFADGGPTSAENLALRCRAHNAYEMEVWSPSPGAQAT